MNSKIRIANLLLTRRCTLSCSYCRISGHIDYPNKSREYPDKSYYLSNEQDTDFWINLIDRLYKHNKDIFVILYGGEPFLRKDLAEIVSRCNKIGIIYTIISNCSSQIRSNMNKFFTEVEGKVLGFTASIDPGFYLNDQSDVVAYKSHQGYETLKRLIKNDLVMDPVAEITASASDIKYLEETVKLLDSEGITSDITVLDVARNPYYDFSNITDESLLVQKNEEVKEIFDRLIQSDYKIHMREKLLPLIYENLPAEMDCEIDRNLHNVAIDADGMIRLCLRIRGTYASVMRGNLLIEEDGSISPVAHDLIRKDREEYCEKCIWTCALMSQLNSRDIINH